MKIELTPIDVMQLHTILYHNCEEDLDCKKCNLEDFCLKNNMSTMRNISNFLLQRGTCVTNTNPLDWDFKECEGDQKNEQ